MATEKTRYKVLIVDDEADVLASMKLAVENAGQTVLTAEDGLRALECAAAENPDVVVLDLMLPKRGGFQVLQKLKGNASMKGKRPLVCMITGNEGKMHKSFAEQNGVDDYLRKPFAMGTLLDIIEEFTAKLDKGIPDAKAKA
ncbi:MAG: response regulator transcription factor [Planctomycetota bacterium]|nr:response regulator transcription factor [Planctomycetota bacterium]